MKPSQSTHFVRYKRVFAKTVIFLTELARKFADTEIVLFTFTFFYKKKIGRLSFQVVFFRAKNDL